ncbi:low molecular weight protein arginine phosphatase [Acetivibrio cellulolyticus]|uniref:low molecular weight protein arginine phosphatase n=1 Tax=Acetivibrio cellulolyticus TaxID=35830 RepID=UPI0001E2C71C|nr:low molecular weight protein arginine phosphatase [Acetivibrio cellulolyticus]
MKRVLFVCTGNTCRSIMAEGLFNNAVKKENSMTQFTAFSAGISAYDGECASSYALRVLKDWNIDIGYHISKRITQEDIDNAFVILTMTGEHKRVLLKMFSNAQSKAYTLKEFAYESGRGINGFSTDISDPYGGSEEVYRRCAQQIKEAIDALIQRLKEFEQ